MKDYADYQELHTHKGAEHYEVTTLIPKEYGVIYTFFDTVNKNIITNSYYVSKDNDAVKKVKINVLGMLFDSYEVGTVLKDGTMWDHKYYSNWIVNGDKTKHKYQDPLSEEEKQDPEKWKKKFIKLYNKATYVYETSWDYYFKVKKEWYYMEYNSAVINSEFAKEYPPKEDQDVRMVQLENLTLDVFSAEARQASKDFMELVAYKPTESEKGNWIDPIDYSAGYYMIQLHLPQGDTLKIRNFGSMYPNLKTYKIPKEYGGRQDIIFMLQEPDQELYPNQKWGGMYVIRPRKL